MRVISPGVVALKPFRIYCKELTQEMVDWWIMMGAEAQEIHEDYYDRKGLVKIKHYRIRMPGLGAKYSYQCNDGAKTIIIHLMEQYAPEASLFILKWPENIINHDIRIEDETVLH